MKIKGKNKGAVKRDIVTEVTNIYDVITNGKHLYWAAFPKSRIGRARIDGSRRRPGFMKAGGYACGVTIAKKKLYWAECDNGRIARSNLDGKKKRRNWFKTPGPQSLTSDGKKLYFSTWGSIGWVNLKNRNNKIRPMVNATWGIVYVK